MKVVFVVDNLDLLHLKFITLSVNKSSKIKNSKSLLSKEIRHHNFLKKMSTRSTKKLIGLLNKLMSSTKERLKIIGIKR